MAKTIDASRLHQLGEQVKAFNAEQDYFHAVLFACDPGKVQIRIDHLVVAGEYSPRFEYKMLSMDEEGPDFLWSRVLGERLNMIPNREKLVFVLEKDHYDTYASVYDISTPEKAEALFKTFWGVYKSWYQNSLDWEEPELFVMPENIIGLPEDVVRDLKRREEFSKRNHDEWKERQELRDLFNKAEDGDVSAMAYLLVSESKYADMRCKVCLPTNPIKEQ